MNLFILLCLMIFLHSMESTRAASFDCAKATTSAERLICIDPSLFAIDSELGEAYEARRATTPDVQGVQKDWIVQRDKFCDLPRSRIADAELFERSLCLRATLKKRIRELRASPTDAMNFTMPNLPSSAFAPKKDEPIARPIEPDIRQRSQPTNSNCPTNFATYNSRNSSDLKNGQTNMRGLLSNFSASQYEKAYGSYSRCVAKVQDWDMRGLRAPEGFFCECEFMIDGSSGRNGGFFSVKFDVCSVSSRTYWDISDLKKSQQVLACHRDAGWPLSR